MKKDLNQCLSDLKINIKKKTNDNKKIDNNLNQVNFEICELKEKIDQNVIDKTNLAANLRYNELKKYTSFLSIC